MTTDLFAIIAVAEQELTGSFNAVIVNNAEKGIIEAGYILAPTENIEKTLFNFLELFAPQAAKEFAKDSHNLAQDFRDMLTEIAKTQNKPVEAALKTFGG